MRPVLVIRRPSARSVAGPIAVVVLALVAGGAFAGCAGHETPGPKGSSAASAAASPMSDSPVGMPNGQGMGDSTTLPSPEEIAAAWDLRPAYVSHSGHETESAYAFAVARPDIVEWMPCYCGCASLDHRSNLECFLERRQAGAPIVFEEHASYCEICVKTALMAKQMLGQGATLVQMRAAVDATYGGLGVPGTPTELPPG
jgi:hypothetical protein